MQSQGAVMSISEVLACSSCLTIPLATAWREESFISDLRFDGGRICKHAKKSTQEKLTRRIPEDKQQGVQNWIG